MARPTLADLKRTPGPAARGGGPSVADLPSVHDLLETPGPATSSTRKKKGGGGFLHGVGHALGGVGGVVSRGAADLEHVAINAPAGAVQLGERANDLLYAAQNLGTPRGNAAFNRVKDYGKETVVQTKDVVEHPLRHPGLTALTLLPAASGLARGLEIAGGVDIAAPRTLRIGEATVHPEGSRSALGRTVHRFTDTRAQKAIDKNPAGRRARRAESRFGKVVTAEGKQATRVASGAPNALLRMGRKLSLGEQKALQVVAEGAPLDKRITAASARVTGARDDVARIRHHGELDALHAAKPHLTTESGRPALVSPKLQKVYTQMGKVAGDRETLLKQLQLLTDESIQARKTNAARISLGGTHVKPTPAKLGQPSKALIRQRNLVKKLEERFTKASAATRAAGAKIPGTTMVGLKAVGEGLPRTITRTSRNGEPVEQTVTRARTVEEAQQRLDQLEKEHNKFLDLEAKKRWGPIGKEASEATSAERRNYKKATSGTAAAPGAKEAAAAARRVKKLEAKVAELRAAGTAPEELAKWEKSLANTRIRAAESQHLLGKTRASSSSGRKAVNVKTETQQRRDTIDREMANFIEKNADQPAVMNHPALRSYIERTDEIAALRGALNPDLFETPSVEGRGTVTETRTRPATVTTKRTVKGPGRVITPTGGARAERLGGALSLAREQLASMEAAAAKRVQPTGVLGAEDFEAPAGSIRIPDVPTRRGARSLNRQGTVGAQGSIGELKKPGSVTHAYTGALREHALRRQDTTALVAESGLEAAKYAGLKTVHDLVRKAARPGPLRPDDVAVRLDQLSASAKLPHDVARFVSDPEEYFSRHRGDPEQSGMLDKARSLLFFPGRDKGGGWQLDPSVSAAARAEFERLSEEGKIGWVPKRVLGELAHPSVPLRGVTGGKPVTVWDTINNSQRFAILYLKPAYAVPNILGNAALNLVQQGWAAPRNLAQAARLVQRLQDEDYATIDAAMGEGAARAISAEGRGHLAGVVDFAAGKWSTVVDTPFRRASFIHEARKAGYKTPDQLHELLSRDFQDPELTRIGVRANRDVIDYENLSPVEREIIRRVVFFYPWVKGSTVYAGRFLREHPIQAAVVGRLGANGQQFSEQGFGGAPPSYLEGLIPFGDRAVNPSSASILQTPAQVAMAAQGLASGRIPSAAEASNFITPALALALAETQRTNPSTGVPYKPGTPGWKIAVSQLGHLPQVSLFNELTGRTGQRPLFQPGTGSAIGRFFLGGLYPRKINRNRLQQLARSEQRRLRSR